VISCGQDNSYGHPAAATMEKLRDMNIPVYRTDAQGTIIALSDGDTISWNQEPCNDYAAGDAKQQSANSDTSQAAQYSSEDTASAPAVETETPDISSDTQGRTVWISATGSKYHSRPDCGNMNPNKATQETEAQALSQGYEACKKCW